MSNLFPEVSGVESMMIGDEGDPIPFDDEEAQYRFELDREVVQAHVREERAEADV